ncbi:hypothetical protein DFJ67_0826 [Asanoa ferruginea]|uniref:Uncharacterized protein n=1 Tax=Asanoa ferruginea TaxID=53367 RepID=A0A3D9ZC47_9ACTN|nr:hypothetical protein DFJ67_0826 [Asanoa ferruginea]
MVRSRTSYRLLILSAHVSQAPLARGLNERKAQLSGMILVDLLTMRYAALAPRRPRRARM